MPVYTVEGPDGRRYKIEGPEGATAEQLAAVIQSQGVSPNAEDSAPAEPAQAPSGTMGDGAPKAIANTGLEFMAGVNRGATGLVDFVAGAIPNAVAYMAGSDWRMPRLTDGLESATAGNFAEDGLVKDIARSAGEVIPAAVSGGAMLRTAANQLPRFGSGSEGVLSGAIRQMGNSTLGADAGLGALSGAGMPLGGEVGEAVGGETGRQVGEMVGALALPVAAAGTQALGSRLAGAIESRATDSAVRSAIKEAAPGIDELKQTSRAIYGEIDDLGVTLKPQAVDDLVDDLASVGREFGMDPDVVPKAAKALKRFEGLRGESPTLSEVDTIRRIAQNAAKSTEPAEAAAGGALVRRLDDFLDELEPGALVRGQADAKEVSTKYRQARDLWGRARRSELLEEAFTKAKLQASGFENGVRIQFRQLLNNKKTRKLFSEQERELMTKVVEGGKGENFARLLGRLSPAEGSAHNLLSSGVGVAGGAAVGGPVGAVAVPAVGYVSRGLAGRMTANNAKFADQVVRAGRNAEAIAKAYIQNTPKAQRSAQELSELLMRPEIDLSSASGELAREAAGLVRLQQAGQGVLSSVAANEGGITAPPKGALESAN